MDQEQVQALRTQAEESAKNYFRQGLNCAECALKSFLDLGLTDDSPEVVAMASGFGGGIGLTRNTCGAVLGAAMAIGTLRGRRDPLAKETLQERIEELYGTDGIYQLYRRFVEEVEGKYGTIVCREMTAGYEWEGKPRKKNCQEIIRYTAGLAVKYALENTVPEGEVDSEKDCGKGGEVNGTDPARS